MTDPDRVGMREQIDWANKLNDVRISLQLAEAAVRREEYDKAHANAGRAADELEAILEEFPRYIHEAPTGEVTADE
jgi:hypothetical protein